MLNRFSIFKEIVFSLEKYSNGQKSLFIRFPLPDKNSFFQKRLEFPKTKAIISLKSHKNLKVVKLFKKTVD